ncbi:MAG TPA: hypothetical protein VFW28_00165 [Micropepsaceae bacterium]|nr:hypothetical protein [Micropepsaceae bacterium]
MRNRLMSLPAGTSVVFRAEKPLYVLLMVLAGIAFVVGVNIWLAFGAIPYS